jgi:hypothetical protein
MRGRSKKILIGTGIVVAILGIVYSVALMRAKARLREAYAALEQDGRPLRIDDVLPPEVPDEQNAAVLYEKAAAMLEAEPSEEEKNLLEELGRLARALFEEPTKPERIARRQQDVARLKQRMVQDVVTAALAIVEQGTQRPACRFEHDETISLSDDKPVSSRVRTLVVTVGARARLEAEAGDPQKAWDTIQTQLRFGQTLSHDPVALDPWIRFAATGHACRVIKHVCEIAPPDEEDYQVIEQLLRAADDVEPFVRLLDAERLWRGEGIFSLPADELYKVLREYQTSFGGGGPEFFDRLVFRRITFAPTFVADHAAYLQVMRKSVQMLEGPFVSRDAPEYQEIGKLTRRYGLTARLAPYSSGMKYIHCRMAADVRMVRAGLALLRFKQHHGAFPQVLDALELGGLTDPFDGKPLRYRPEAEGFVVYSVDEDQKDNDGKTRQRKQKTDYDRVWRFGIPETRANDNG